MYLKIKLEPSGVHAEENLNKVKEAAYLQLGDEPTIYDMKLKIEQHIFVPVGQQEIRNISRTLYDMDKIMDIDEHIASDGASLLLYTRPETRYDEPSFMCILQLYSDKDAAVQQDFDRKSKDPMYFNCPPGSVASTITLVADSDSEEEPLKNNKKILTSGSSSSSEDVSASSSTDSESADSTTDSDSAKSVRSRKRARSTKPKDSVPFNKTKNSSILEKIPAEVSKFMDEFPVYNMPPADSTNLVQNVQILLPKAVKRTLSYSPESSAKKHAITTNVATHASKFESAIVQKVTPQQAALPTNNLCSSSSNITTTNKTSSGPSPCPSLSPEQRAQVVILSAIDETKDIGRNEYLELLEQFIKAFEKTDNIADLQFNSGAVGPVLYEGSIWIACGNSQTLAWTLAESNALTKQHTGKTFADFHKLRKCLVVIPSVGKTKSMTDVFLLLEQQNPAIRTSLWTFSQRRLITAADSEVCRDKCVSCLYRNEELTLFIDATSWRQLEERNFVLNYCFWKIEFEFK